MMNNCIRRSASGPRLSQNGIKSQGRVKISFAQCPQSRTSTRSEAPTPRLHRNLPIK